MNLQRYLRVAIVALLALNGVLLLGAVLLNRSRKNAMPTFQGKIDFGDPISIDGQHVINQQATCRLVHYTARSCEFCQREIPIWEKLRKRAVAAKCNVLIVAPNAAEVPNRTLKADLALFVTPKFAESFGVTHTPTTVLTTGNGQMIWGKQGELFGGDLQQASQLMIQATPAAQ